MTRARLAWPLALVLVALAVPARAEVSARVDRTTVSLNETVNLEIEVGAGGGRVGSPEGEDFLVVGHSTFSNIEIINGRQTQRSTTTLTLRPSRLGTLTVGRVPVRTATGVEYTAPIEVEVTARPQAAGEIEDGAAPGPVRPTRQGSGAVTGPSARRRPAEPLSPDLFTSPVPRVQGGEPFIVATVTASEPYVGQQVVVDYILFTPSSAFGVEGIELTEPEFADAWFMDITESRTSGSSGRLGARRVGAELYDAQVLRSYAMFPLETGEVIVPPIGLELAFRGFARRTGRRVVHSRPLVLDVKTPPDADEPAGFNLGNVGDLDFVATADEITVRVGDAVTVTMIARGSALFSRVTLPELEAPDGFRVYPPDDSHVQDVSADLWIRGSATRRVTVVPTREGEFTLPPLVFATFDPWAGTYQVAESDPIVVTVSGLNPHATVAVDGDELPTAVDWLEELPPPRLSSAPSGASTRWFRTPAYAAAALAPAVIWLAVVVGAGLGRRREVTADDRRARHAARHALAGVRDGDPGAVAAALRTYLEDITGKPARGLTNDRLRAVVSGVAGAEAGRMFGDAVEAAERARYEGGDPAEIARSAADAVRAVEASR